MPSYTPSDRGREADPACACRQPPRMNTASIKLALLREASSIHVLVGPVPLYCGGEREAAVWLASRDASHAPQDAPRSSGVLGGSV